MRVLGSFVGGWGHAEPLLAIATWAQRLGHQVTFAGQAAVVGRLAALRFETEVVGPSTLATATRPLAPVDRAAEQTVMREHFIARFGRSRAKDLGALCDRMKPDLVICDEVDVGSVAAAELRGVPCVTVTVLAAGLLMSPTAVGHAWNSLREELSLDYDPSGQRLGGDLTIAPLPRSLRSPRAPAPATMRFVRPPIVDHVASINQHSDRPLVYATLGTVFNMESGDLLARIVDAMTILSDANGLDVVITTGPGIHPAQLPAPGPRVRVEAYVPQRELLGRCRAVVSHAGSGTLAAVLSLGIPVVMLPLGADQPDNADRCSELGVGITLDPVRATPTEIAESTQATLDDPRFPAAAAALAAEATTQPALHTIPELQEFLETSAM
jgi:UDP:flavonoid glycosyltransferase YjiC (YdhE family)